MIADAVFLCDYLHKAYYLKIKLLVLKDNIKNKNLPTRTHGKSWTK